MNESAIFSIVDSVQAVGKIQQARQHFSPQNILVKTSQMYQLYSGQRGGNSDGKSDKSFCQLRRTADRHKVIRHVAFAFGQTGLPTESSGVYWIIIFSNGNGHHYIIWWD